MQEPPPSPTAPAAPAPATLTPAPPPEPAAAPPVEKPAHFFDRIVVIDRGRLVADGPPDVALTPERIHEVFGVDPSLVRLPQSVTGSAVV